MDRQCSETAPARDRARSQVDRLIDDLPLEPVPKPHDVVDGMPYVTHSGVLCIGEHNFAVHQLSTGVRVLDVIDIERFFAADPINSSAASAQPYPLA